MSEHLWTIVSLQRFHHEIFISFGFQIHGSSKWLQELAILFAYSVIYFHYFIAITMTGRQTVWKTSFKACWCYPLIICHQPLCFPVVFSEEGINQVICHHLLTEPGRFSLLMQNTLDKYHH